jgi:antitoxin HicB
MQSLSYAATLSSEKNGAFTVTFADLPEAITSGVNLQDALEQAADCLQEAIAGRIVRKEDIPLPAKPRRGQHGIEVALYLAPKLALYLALRGRRMSNSELARRLKTSETVIRRMLDPHHDTKPEKLQAALEALGKRIRIAVSDAA